MTALAAVAVAFAVVGSARGEQDSPEGAVRAFEAAAQRGDRELMLELLGPETRARLARDAQRASDALGGIARYGELDLVLPRPASRPGLAGITTVAEQDGRAVLEITLDDESHRTLSAVVVNGRWRIEIAGTSGVGDGER